MVMITSAVEANSAGVLATDAPASASGLILSAERFQTVSVLPVSMRRRPMFAPIRPTPAIPICMGGSLLLAQFAAVLCEIDDRRSARVTKVRRGWRTTNRTPTTWRSNSYGHSLFPAGGATLNPDRRLKREFGNEA